MDPDFAEATVDELRLVEKAKEGLPGATSASAQGKKAKKKKKKKEETEDEEGGDEVTVPRSLLLGGVLLAKRFEIAGFLAKMLDQVEIPL